MLSSLLAACSSASAATGPVTLNFYANPDVSGATAKIVAACSAQSHGQYTISYQVLPNASDQQRQQLIRRLAAHDNSIDIMMLDVTWAPEFAEAGWVVPWTGSNKQQAETGTLKPALETAIWHNQLVAVPDFSNTELLWYRSDLVKTPPVTWAQMIDDSIQLAKEGKPHYIEIQGAQYEGATVWFNTMLASAGGRVLTPDAEGVSLGAPALTALTMMKRLGTSVAADPSLGVQQENENRLAMEAGTAAFELNYPFVYPSMKADNPQMFRNFKWAPYPEVIPGHAGARDHRRHRSRGQCLLPVSPARLPSRAVPAGQSQPAGERHGRRPPAHPRWPLQRSGDVPQLSVPRRDLAGAAERQRAAGDARLPGPVHRHLAPGLAAGQHQSGEHRAKHDRRDQQCPAAEGVDPVSRRPAGSSPAARKGRGR